MFSKLRNQLKEMIKDLTLEVNVKVYFDDEKLLVDHAKAK